MSLPIMSNSLFPPRHIFFPSAKKHETTIIFLHERAYGINGEQIASHLNLARPDGKAIYDYFPATRWVFPSSRERQFYWPQTQRRTMHDNRKSISEWFEVSSFQDVKQGSNKQLIGLQDSASHIMRIIEDELKHVNHDPKRIFLGGIGQGMALGLVVLLCTPHQLGGFVGINGWIPFAETLKAFVQQGDIDGASLFFKSNDIAPIKPPNKPRQDAPKAIQTHSATIPSSSRQDNSPSAVQSAGSEATISEEIKQTPILVSHASRKGLYVPTEFGHTAYSLMGDMGFSRLTWKDCSNGQYGDELPKGSEENIVYSLMVPEQLKDAIHFLGDLGMK